MSGATDSRPDGGRADFLAGLRVLELGDDVAGSSATSILWALGADVTAVVDESSSHRRGRPRVRAGDGETSLLSVGLDRGKQCVRVSGRAELDAIVAEDADGGFDLVVFDRVFGPSGPLASLHDVASYADFVAGHNRNAWLTISAFGLSGDRAEDVGTELTVAAAGGMLSAVRDPATGQPLKLAGQQSLLNTGQAGALAGCHAIDLAADGHPVHLDLSAAEATLAMGPVLEVGGQLLDTGGGGGAKRYGAPAGFYECVDGLLRISAMEDHQWQGVVAAMGSPAWSDRFATVESRIDAPEQVDEHVAAWTKSLEKLEAERILQSHGVPATAVNTPEEILASPQLGHRGAFEDLPVGDGRSARVVGLPFQTVAGGNGGDRTGSRRRRSLRGLRMLEASRVLAVPLAGAILGALGVEVTKLEDTRRLDMYRRRGPYIDGEAGMERSAYFALMNHSKRSVAFDVDADPERLATLLDNADVVIENLGRKRASALGLAASTALEQHPDLLAVSSTGFGQDGPHADYRAYAYNLQASCALGFLTRNAAGDSAEIDIAWADLISGYALATIVAAWAVGPSGNAGVGLDFAMADLVVSHFNEFLAAAGLQADSDESVDRANDLSPFAPHGVYPTADGWVALSVDHDEQFARLSEVLDLERFRDPAPAYAEGRRSGGPNLDAVIARATMSFRARELAAALRDVGVIAEQVVAADEVLESSQLAVRGFFATVDHREWGPRRLVGLPWRRFAASPLPLGSPPTLDSLGEEQG